ncbi:predicted protein [Streptomyces filamentosus NRRL 15998]|uniref:Predicted protein n=1 Tax=Streptomyces filamentosus NRRL 15998 TaxID=457431 RepID=D6ANH8_STRFL|nr:predicted protein [Streptomyces filamentosus NRRL 15998]
MRGGPEWSGRFALVSILPADPAPYGRRTGWKRRAGRSTPPSADRLMRGWPDRVTMEGFTQVSDGT